MSPLPTVERTGESRARRWDAVILGSGATALMTAARLGMAGHRVLIVEEAARRDAFPGLQEPFFLAGVRDQGIVDEAMRAISIPLIDRRRIQASESAFQIVAPDLRLEVGEASLSARELEIWGVMAHGEARPLTSGLREFAEAERQAMLASPVVRTSRTSRAGRALGMRGGRRSPSQAAYPRGLPSEVASASGTLAHLLDVQVRVLSNLAVTLPSPEAKSRLLGSVQSGGAGFRDGPPWFMGLLRRRVESCFGEFRTPPGDFRLVTSRRQPGLALSNRDELWLGRVLIIATAVSPLAQILDQDPIPEFLQAAPVVRRRLAIHLRCPRSVLPEGMGPRVILTGDGQTAPKGPDPICLSVYASPDDRLEVDLVVRAVVDPASDRLAAEQALEESVRELLRFAGSDLKRCPVEHPRWDDDGWLEDPLSGSGWPTELALRVSSRPPVYRLDRAEVAGLGFEGDLLLGWRAGDAIAADLG